MAIAVPAAACKPMMLSPCPSNQDAKLTVDGDLNETSYHSAVTRDIVRYREVLGGGTSARQPLSARVFGDYGLCASEEVRDCR
jgi:hypothetical protein